MSIQSEALSPNSPPFPPLKKNKNERDMLAHLLKWKINLIP